MVAGQVIDLLGEGQPIRWPSSSTFTARRPARCSWPRSAAAARLGGGGPPQLEALTEYARALGLAFQVIDDMLDVESSTEQLGKRTQKDHAHGKATYPAILGVEESRAFARRLEDRALTALASFDSRADPLRRLASFTVERRA